MVIVIVGELSQVQMCVYIPQRGVQWKQGVVIHIMLYTSLWYTTPIHCTPLRLHPPVMNTQQAQTYERSTSGERAHVHMRVWVTEHVL